MKKVQKKSNKISKTNNIPTIKRKSRIVVDSEDDEEEVDDTADSE